MEQNGVSRTTPMQVLALGMCRTGTESMRRGLTQLGYGFVYHARATTERPGDHPFWVDLIERKFGPRKAPIRREHFDRILGDCGAVTDCPCVAFWEELMDAYPEAKIVLQEREVETWYRSFETVVLNGVMGWRTSILIWASKHGLVDGADGFVQNDKVICGAFKTRSRREIPRNARAVYKEHYAAIAARAEREGRPALNMKLGAGWEPLCEFLGKPIPNDDFPRGNESAFMVRVTREVQNTMLLQLFGTLAKAASMAVVSAGLVAFLAKWWLKR